MIRFLMAFGLTVLCIILFAVLEKLLDWVFDNNLEILFVSIVAFLILLAIFYGALK